MTKTELLEHMDKYGACREAYRYVANHASDSAEQIGLGCKAAGWLVWMLVNEDVDLTNFMERSTDRAKDYVARYGYADACATLHARYAARYATDAARYATDAARYARYSLYSRTVAAAARYASDAAWYASDAAWYAEQETQLAQLHALWAEWCKS